MITGGQPQGDRNPPRAPSEHGRPSGGASLRYGLQILGLFSAERQWLRIGEIAHELGLSPLAAHAEVSAMRRMQLVREGPDRRYGLSAGPPELGLSAVRSVGMARHARPHLLALQRRTGLPVALATLDGTELLVVDRSHMGERKVEMTIDLDHRLPAHATALGKVLLAYLPEHREQAMVESIELPRTTSRTIVDRRQLLKHLQLVRTRGMALEDREYVLHRRCIAVPVRGAARHVIAALGLTMADTQTPLKELADRYEAYLTATAQRLSAKFKHAQVDWPAL